MDNNNQNNPVDPNAQVGGGVAQMPQAPAAPGMGVEPATTVGTQPVMGGTVSTMQPSTPIEPTVSSAPADSMAPVAPIADTSAPTGSVASQTPSVGIGGGSNVSGDQGGAGTPPVAAGI